MKDITFHSSPLIDGYHVQVRRDGDWFGVGYTSKVEQTYGPPVWAAFRRDSDYRGQFKTRKAAAERLVREFDR